MIRRKAIQAVAKRFAKRSSKTFKRVKKRSSKTFKRVKKSVIKKVKYLKLSKAERQALKKRQLQRIKRKEAADTQKLAHLNKKRKRRFVAGVALTGAGAGLVASGLKVDHDLRKRQSK